MPKTRRNRAALNSQMLQQLNTFWTHYGSPILEYGKVPVREKSVGVGGNTFRAYGEFRKPKNSKQNKPSLIFQAWAQNNRILPRALQQTVPFHTFHERAVCSLATYWKRHAGVTLKRYPYAAKLVDLHLKHIIWHSVVQPERPKERITNKRRRQLLSQLFQPLDKYSLHALAQFGATLRNDVKIPSTASMGLVDTKAEYCQLQETIAFICRKARVPTFAFDQYAWNQRDDNEK